MSVITNPWVLAALSTVAYVTGWLVCATWWTRSQLREWVKENPGVSRAVIAEQRQKEAAAETGFALAWPLLLWVYLAIVIGERVPPLVARWSQHPVEQQDLRETKVAPR
jgi:hypothetical protein